MSIVIEPPRSMFDRIADRLRDEIADGRPGVGDDMPSETRLAARFGVSRVTVNRAIARLRAEGVVEVRRGLATRVIAARAPTRITVPADLWDAIATTATAADMPATDWALDVLRAAARNPGGHDG